MASTASACPQRRLVTLTMQDLAFLALAAVLFVASGAYVRACERLVRSSDRDSGEQR